MIPFNFLSLAFVQVLALEYVFFCGMSKHNYEHNFVTLITVSRLCCGHVNQPSSSSQNNKISWVNDVDKNEKKQILRKGPNLYLNIFVESMPKCTIFTKEMNFVYLQKNLLIPMLGMTFCKTMHYLYIFWRLIHFRQNGGHFANRKNCISS